MIRRRRSCLTVPGDDERKLARAATSAADQVILDLEDAVAPRQKDAARETVARALRDRPWAAQAVSLRINGPGTPWHADDLVLARELSVATIVVPKLDRPEDLPDVSSPVEALIESAAGLVNCEAIAASPTVEALILGPGDLAASLGTPTRTIGAGPHLDYARVRVLVAARAAGCAAVDGPFAAFTDEDGFRASAQAARELGFDGKWCIHPSQIEAANTIFSPTPEELEWAHRASALEGAGADLGEMVDAATRRMALALLARQSPPVDSNG
jgi:citrate lyase subunit beta/citryl-CoA lyase